MELKIMSHNGLGLKAKIFGVGLAAQALASISK